MNMNPMLGRTLSHFRIVSQLGEGGMGVVYEAEDIRLGRHVALKVLPPERVGDEERRLRFLREARTAAAISHPSIAAIHEIDEADGVIFIAMELVEGQTLRSALQGGVPPLKKSLRMAAEVAEALSSAHQANIVHRDLKPENVMIRPDGHVKILDFGLAKLREDAARPPEMTRMETLSAEMTQEGRILGTAAYMSPEQARGQAVDFRSDLFSFGILLYEMTTGRQPFQAASVTDTLSSIVRDQPPPVGQVAPGVPDELSRIVAKCLDKDPDERYQHTDDLAMDLRKLVRVTDSQAMYRVSDAVAAVHPRPVWRRPLPLLLAAIGLVALVLGLGALFRGGGLLPGRGRAASALAVLTFENLQDSQDTQRLGQILQELVITDLSELDSLTVFSSQRLFDIQKQLGGAGSRQIDRALATKVAAKAGATTMLTGSLSRLGSSWVLTGQLVEVSSGRVVKSERIDGEDLYRMVDELTGKIREDLRLSQAEIVGVDRAVGDRTTSSLEAYQHYLEGTELLAAWKFDDAAEAFRKALAIDPSFGQARFKQAIAAWWALGGAIPESEEKSPSALLRGLLEGDFKLSAKDRRLAEGMLAVVEDRHKDAEQLLSSLVADYPDEKEAWYGLGEARYHQPGGDRQAGYAAFERALDLDPTFQLAYRHLSEMYREQKRYREGIEKLRALLEHDPDDPTYYEEWIRLLLMDGDTAGADDVLRTARERITAPEARREFLLDAAQAYDSRDDHDRNVELLREALAVETDVKTDTVLSELGWHFRNEHDFRQAEDYFLRALDLNPEGGGALWGLFQVYDAERRFADGILRARGLVQRDPDHLAFYHQWIRMAVQKGDAGETDRAIQAAREQTGAGGAESRLWLEVGNAFMEVGDEVKAAEMLQKAESGAPEGFRWRVMLRLAWNALNQEQYELAVERFRAAADEDTLAEQQSYNGLAQALLELRRDDEALEAARKHVEVHPEEAGARGWLVTVLLASGREAEADEALDEGLAALDLAGSKRGLLGNLASVYGDAKGPERGEELARRAVALDPEVRDPWLRNTLANVLRRQGRYDEAEEVLRQALDATPRALWPNVELAWLELERGRPVAAERRVRDLLADGPASRGAFQHLAQILAEENKFADAEPYARRAFAMNPDRAGHAVLAWVLIAGDRDLDEGVRLAETARKMPESWRAQFHRGRFTPSPEHSLGLARLRQGRPGEAVKLLERAASLQPDRALIREHLAEARRAAR